MSYLWITSSCNFSCDHCGVDLGNGKPGKMIDMTVLHHALTFISKYGEYVTLGGGEATLHPQFRKIVQKALDFDLIVHIISNGSREHQIKWLIDQKEMYGDKLHFEISDDQFHLKDSHKVKSWVYEYAKRNKIIRNNIKLVKAGRAINLENKTYLYEPFSYDNGSCLCETLTVKLDGSIYHCGCENSHKYGNVIWDDKINYQYPECWNSLDESQKDEIINDECWAA